MAKGALWLFVGLFVVGTVQGHSLIGETNNVDSLARDFASESSHSHHGVAVLPSYCWNTAISLLGNPNSIPEAATFCANLPVEWQKKLALELVRCHLEDVDRPLFRGNNNANVEQHCASDNLADIDTIHVCLRNLSDAAERAYSFYMPHIQTLCTRKTQELFIQYQQEKQEEMASQYADIAGRSVDELEALQQASTQLVSEINSKLLDIPGLVEEQVSQRLENTLREELGKKLQDRIEELLQVQASQQASVFDDVMDGFRDREAENRQHYEDWAYYQSTLMLQQAKEMEHQRDSMKQHRGEMEELAQKVSETSMHMQPLVGLQSLLKTATEGYAWLNLLLYFLVTFNIVWVLTRPKLCRWFRPYIFSVVLLESAVEIAATIALSYQLIDDSDRTNAVYGARRVSILVECIAYVFALIAGCLGSKRSHRHRHDEEDSDYNMGQRLIPLDPTDVIPYPYHHGYGEGDGYESSGYIQPRRLADPPRRVPRTKQAPNSYERAPPQGYHPQYHRSRMAHTTRPHFVSPPAYVDDGFRETIDAVPAYGLQERPPAQNRRRHPSCPPDAESDDTTEDQLMEEPRLSPQCTMTTLATPPSTPNRLDSIVVSNSHANGAAARSPQEARNTKRPAKHNPEDQPPSKKKASMKTP